MKTITLDWDDNTEADLAGYNIYRNGSKIATVGKVSTYQDTVTVDGDYTYYVTAYDTGNLESAKSNEPRVTVNTNPPAAPQNLRATVEP